MADDFIGKYKIETETVVIAATRKLKQRWYEWRCDCGMLELTTADKLFHICPGCLVILPNRN